MVSLLSVGRYDSYNLSKEIVVLVGKRFTELGVETLINQVSLIVCFPTPPQDITKNIVFLLTLYY